MSNITSSRGIAISVTYSECVCIARVIWHAKPMRRIIVSHLWPVRLYHIFPHYLIHGTILWKEGGIFEHKMCFDFFHKFCPQSFSFQEEFSEILSYMSIALHVMYPLFLSHFDQTWVFSADYRKILQYQISLKFVHLEPNCRCGQTDRQTWPN